MDYPYYLLLCKTRPDSHSSCLPYTESLFWVAKRHEMVIKGSLRYATKPLEYRLTKV